MITTKWIVENGIGHWLVSCDDYSISCDENELYDAIEEVKSYAK